MLHEGVVAVALGRDAVLRAAPRVVSQMSRPHSLSEKGGLAITQSNVSRPPVLASLKAGCRSVSSRAIWKSSMPWSTRFMRAIDEVVRFFSWP